MGFLSWLEQSSLAAWVVESLVAYPVILALHGIGMAFLVGTLLMFNIRLLGFSKGLSVPAFSGLMTIAVIGLFANTITGLLLFMPDANRFFTSPPFITKISLIFIGLVLHVVLRNKYLVDADQWSGGDAPAAVKGIATVSVVAWLGAIVAGRLIAYL